MTDGTPEKSLWVMVAKTLLDDCEEDMQNAVHKYDKVSSFLVAAERINFVAKKWKGEANRRHFLDILDIIEIDVRLFEDKIDEFKTQAHRQLELLHPDPSFLVSAAIKAGFVRDWE